MKSYCCGYQGDADLVHRWRFSGMGTPFNPAACNMIVTPVGVIFLQVSHKSYSLALSDVIIDSTAVLCSGVVILC